MPLRNAAGPLATAIMCCVAAQPVPGRAETFASIYTGSSRTRQGDLQLSQPALGTELNAQGVRWSADPLRLAPYYGLRVTHFADEASAWGFAVDYTHYKIYARTDRQVSVTGTSQGAPVSAVVPLDRFVQRFEISHGVNMLSLNGVYRWPDVQWAGHLQPYVGLGAAYYLAHAESTVGGLPHETGYRSSGFGAQTFAGLRYRMTERTGVFAEAKYNTGKARVDIAGGRAETPLRTFHLMAGISVDFP